MNRDKHFIIAEKFGNRDLAELPKIKNLVLEKRNRRMKFDLSNGVTLIVPADSIQGLQKASDVDLTNIELWDEGLMIYWKRLDVAFQTSSLLLGVFGTKQWMKRMQAGKNLTGPNIIKKQNKKVA
ncbi:MAG: DUF2442 domain-containing protein [Acidobacteria bacterium]|nr:DUF2442 domain-containing protein [Acidobacteriota bacterium]